MTATGGLLAIVMLTDWLAEVLAPELSVTVALIV
jgi:hypothetical protein